MMGNKDVLLVGVPIVLMTLLYLWALLDCVRTPRYRVQLAPKLLWVIFLLYAPVLGSLVWIYLGKKPKEDMRKGPTHGAEPFAQRR
ncbi:PLD nuclease N-terminal domain-containing protein [Streptomyces sp. NPDC002588]|uniref:PLD nuclease N-terminal domain-containing protein n=1 Tax=Streptomyces sp. NPDC002588 TaxID=3154419 RepID=UPI00332C8379